MENYKCAFSGALIGKQNGCQYALEVTRREGPSIACTSQQMHKQCAVLLDALKSAALPQFGYEDDLTQMPHSVMMKIQAGGLAALQKHLHSTTGLTAVDNVAQLVMDVNQHYDAISSIPFDRLVQDIVDFKLRRRR